MKKKVGYIGLFLVITLILLWLINKQFMSSNKDPQKAITLYVMDYGKWDSTFRQKLNEGADSYKRWFLENAREIDLPDSVYRKAIIENPIINTGISNTLLDQNYHMFPDTSSDLIYFILDPSPFLMAFRQPVYQEHKIPEVDSFAVLLQDIADKRIFVLAAYSKKNGWFDYEKVSIEKEKFKKQHQLEMQQLEERLRKKSG